MRWPHGQPRTDKPIRSKFGDHLLRETLGELMDEVKKIGGTEIVVSSELPIGKSGWPIQGWNKADDHGVAVYWKGKDSKPYCLAIDRYDHPMDNLWAIVKSLEAIRALARWGGDQLINQALSSFAELPPPTAVPWWVKVLELEHLWPDITDKSVAFAFRHSAKRLHPDAGGSNEDMAQLNAAFDAAKEELGF